MLLSEIKQAVESGKMVCWSNRSYRVVKDKLGQWFIHCTTNDNYIGLTHSDGVTLNGKGSEFYVSNVNVEQMCEWLDLVEAKYTMETHPWGTHFKLKVNPVWAEKVGFDDIGFPVLEDQTHDALLGTFKGAVRLIAQ